MQSRTDEQREANVSRFFHDYRDRPGGTARFLAGRPLESVRAVIDLIGLPVITAETSTHTVEGALIDRALAQRHTMRRFLPHAAVLSLPSDPARYTDGGSKRTLRQMVRKAQRHGMTWREIDDPAERLALIREADEWERTSPDLQYRNETACNEECVGYRRWLGVYSQDGRLLLLSVILVEGEWALLRYFRTIGRGAEQSLARHYLMPVIVERLVRDGVRHLFDETSPAKLPNGLRLYQRLVGFRVTRILVKSHTREWGKSDA